MATFTRKPTTRRRRTVSSSSSSQPQTSAAKPATPKAKRPGPRGWRGRGAGETVLVDPAPEWRGTTVQVCGLYPFGIGAGIPAVGVPLGRHLMTGATVCADPISWFQRANLIRNPSMGVLGLTGLGKSSLLRRIASGSAAFGAIPLILGDIRPDYVGLIRELDGDVLALGGTRGYINPLDTSEAIAAARTITATATRRAGEGDTSEAGRLERVAADLVSDAQRRRRALVTALLVVQRGQAVTEDEVRILTAALAVLDEEHTGEKPPLLKDLLQVIRNAPKRVRDAALDRDDRERYLAKTESLEGSLIGLADGTGVFGETFARHSSARLRRDRPAVFDLSSIQENEPELRAAALLASWSAGFGTVNIAQALATAGLEKQRHYLIVQDEISQALRAGPGMVERFDVLSRLNRGFGVGQILCTHTMHDMNSLPTEEDREKARGLYERSGMVVLGGLPGAEMPLLTRVIPLSRSEQTLLQKWNEPPSWDVETGEETTPPGMGHFLIKVAGKPGIPFRLEFTPTEYETGVHDTNSLWHESSRIGGGTGSTLLDEPDTSGPASSSLVGE